MYAIDGNSLVFSFSKGKQKVDESYPLAELSPMLGYWKGYPRSTRANLRVSGLLVITASLLFLFLDGFWIIGLVLLLEAARRVAYEAEFLLPMESTVVSYSDGGDCLYMQRGSGGEEEEKRVAFELALKNAIEKIRVTEGKT